jgi:uncharacterized protein (DUF1697 family)
MPRYVVLLRGVNVGKGNRVAMVEFKSLLEGLGCTGVKTLLNSGNAVFGTSARSVEKIALAVAAQVEEKFGVTTPVIVKSAAELASIIHGAPMTPAEAEESRFLVAFGRDEQALQALAPLVPLATSPERLVITPQAAYLHCPAGLLESKVGQAMLGKAGRGVTTRNWATVLKIEALLCERPGG